MREVLAALIVIALFLLTGISAPICITFYDAL